MARIAMTAAVACAWIVAPIGCGPSNGLAPVRGQVQYQGEPAAGATLYFHRTEPGAPTGEVARAEVQPDGWFRAASGDLGDGVAPGRYAVLVEWRQGPPRTHRLDTARSVGKAAAREGKPLLIADDKLKGRYFDINHPRVVAEVKPGRNDLPTIELKD